jgi:hypothetical protein
MACSNGQGTSVPITAAVWRRHLSSGGSRSMRADSTACTVAGMCMSISRGNPLWWRQAVCPRFADQDPGFHQRAHALFQKERIPLSTGNEELCERRQTRAIP